jgi:hypothetical protein
MKALKPFAFLGGNKTSAETPVEDGRVVELFRSRAELRKQHEELNETVQRMRDRLKQQEAATQRVQDMFDSLEKRLESADSGLSTLVFYHLRALWLDGREVIAALVKDLAAKQEEKERKAFALQGNRKNFQQRQMLDQQLRLAESQMVMARQALSAGTPRPAKPDKWWQRLSKKPKASAPSPGLQSALQAAAQAAEENLQAARARVEDLEKAGAGDFPGLSVDSKRAINIAAIACAEVLCLRLAKTSMVASARAAMSKREAVEYYGDLAACIAQMSDVVKARNLIKQRSALSQELAQRSDRLRGTAAYLSDFDTVPIPESCCVSEGDVLEHRSYGVTSAKLPNVLAEDTWDLFKVLLQ